MKQDMGNMMKQVKQLQDKFTEMEEELKNKKVEGSAGGGMVKATVSGKQQVLSIEIEKEVVDPNEVEFLQDLIIAAINDGMQKAGELANDNMKNLTGGMNLPFGKGMI